MPSIILGPIKIFEISSGGTALFGDTGFISPKNTSKAYSGAATGSTGDFCLTNSINSSTNTIDTDVFDSNNTTGT